MVDVTLYTLPACVQCDTTKRFLDRHHVVYKVVDLSENPQALEHVRELGYTQAPVVEYETKHWSGFRMDKLQGLLNRLFTDNRGVTKTL